MCIRDRFYKGAYGGRVLIEDLPAETTPISELCCKVGLVFQNPFNQLSGAKDNVYEEVAFGMQNLGVPREEMHRRAEEALKLLDIWQYRDRNPFDLSGGQMQRVAIASVLVMNPDILVLDEPTSQLDPQGSEEVFRTVDKLARSGITILMIEQKIEKIAAYCDRILLLHKGRQIAFDTPQKIFSRTDLEELGVQPPAFTRICQMCIRDRGRAVTWRLLFFCRGRNAGFRSAAVSVMITVRSAGSIFPALPGPRRPRRQSVRTG